MRGRNLMLVWAWMILLSCGYTGATTETGDRDSNGNGNSDPPEAPVLELNISQVKQFDFDWMPAVGADYYQLLESADTGEPYTQVGPDVMGLSTSLTVPLHFRLNASYKLAACNADGCTESDTVDVAGPLVEAIGYFKASNTGMGDWFGRSVALSGDGSTLAVGALGEGSSATGIGGDQADDSASDAGAVYVFVRDEQNTWSQQAYVKAPNTDAYDHFGYSVALSADGSTLAVGAVAEDSNATGIGGNPDDDSATGAGAVHVFVRNDQDAWSQQAYVKASNSGADDLFGYSVALSADGSTLAVGAANEESSATGIGGNQADNSVPKAGAVYVFVRDVNNNWSQQAYVKASNPGAFDHSGYSVALSSDGSTLAVGAPGEASSATGIGGNQADNSASGAGAVYVFVRDGNDNWSQQAYVKASNSDADDQFGWSVALNGDGNTLAVSAYYEASNATGIGGNQADNSAWKTGAAYVFVRDGQNAWSQQAYVKASNTGGVDFFGWGGVTLSEDGSTLAVGAVGESSSATGIGGNQADNSAWYAGAVYVFVRDGNDNWSQRAYVKASNSSAEDHFGASVALSGDGSTLAVGAHAEDSSATGIGGNQADDVATGAGAVYLY